MYIVRHHPSLQEVTVPWLYTKAKSFRLRPSPAVLLRDSFDHEEVFLEAFCPSSIYSIGTHTQGTPFTTNWETVFPEAELSTHLAACLLSFSKSLVPLWLSQFSAASSHTHTHSHTYIHTHTIPSNLTEPHFFFC